MSYHTPSDSRKRLPLSRVLSHNADYVVFIHDSEVASSMKTVVFLWTCGDAHKKRQQETGQGLLVSSLAFLAALIFLF